MNILTELDITSIYWAYKIKELFFVFSLCPAIFVCIFIVSFIEGNNRSFWGILVSATILFICWGVCSVLPSKEEVKAAAAYSITKKIANSEKADAVFDKLMKIIEDKIN